MRTGRPQAMLIMSSDEHTRLLAITRLHTLPAALALRAKIVPHPCPNWIWLSS
jgi:hypothetical protein